MKPLLYIALLGPLLTPSKPIQDSLPEPPRFEAVEVRYEVKEQLPLLVSKSTPKPVSVPSNTFSGSLSEWLYKLRMCESGGRYDLNVGKYDGAYQFLDSTWDRWNTGYAEAWQAPPAIQDATVIKNTNASSGGLATQHPGCYKSTGISQFPPN